jgi:hypothetical protein
MDMSKGIRFTDEFKQDAVAQVVERGYIEMFNNPSRKHTNNGMLSPVDYETRQHKLNKAVSREYPKRCV